MSNEYESDDALGDGAFFRPGRAGTIQVSLPEATMDLEEANLAIRSFFTKLAESRTLEPRDDVEEFVTDNALFVLLGPAEEAEFRSMFVVLPPEIADRWDRLLRGGVAADTFGARTDDEVAEEERIDADLQGGRRRRIVLFAALALLIIGGGFGLRQLLQSATEDPGPSLTDFFGGDDEPARNDEGALAPLVVPEFSTMLNTVVAVESGAGPAEDRLVATPTANVLPFAAGSIGAALFEFRGDGYVAVVGPAGFADEACIEVAAVTPQLRALEVAAHGACDDLSEAATGFVSCSGADLVVLQLRIPQRPVELPEGGTGIASEVRIGVLSAVAGFETLELRGLVGVLPDGDVVSVPRFAGPDGSDVSIELPSGLTGSCVIQAAS